MYAIRSYYAVEKMKEVYGPFKIPLIVTDINSAELIKHACNSFLALKISYINAIAAVCEASGANVEDVAHGMGLDKRIGRAFLNAGLGYGGSCFPKDISAFIHIADELGYDRITSYNVCYTKLLRKSPYHILPGFGTSLKSLQIKTL